MKLTKIKLLNAYNKRLLCKKIRVVYIPTTPIERILPVGRFRRPARRQTKEDPPPAYADALALLVGRVRRLSQPDPCALWRS